MRSRTCSSAWPTWKRLHSSSPPTRTSPDRTAIRSSDSIQSRGAGPARRARSTAPAQSDFLEQLAEALAWAADNPQVGKEKYATGNRTDARRARSYARRARLQAGNQGGQGGDKSGPPANGQRPATTAGRPASSGRPSARRPGAGAPTESTAQPAHQDPGSGQQDPADDFLGGAEPPGDDDFLGGGDSPGP